MYKSKKNTFKKSREHETKIIAWVIHQRLARVWLKLSSPLVLVF